jgi:hypothetical protein
MRYLFVRFPCTSIVASLFCVACLNAHMAAAVTYTQQATTVNAGGAHGASASYSQESCIGGISGITAVAAGGALTKAGYLGQIYDVSGIALTTTSTSLGESSSVQLGARETLDDGTYVALSTDSIIWSITWGPLTEISPSGLATADVVPCDSLAVVSGGYSVFNTTLDLTVRDIVPDNFGAYAGDDLGDDWQVQYFGEDNPQAAPRLDPDGDGQLNHFEFVVGLDPTDPSSLFTVQITGNSKGSPQVIFDPVVAGRTYTVKYKDTLDASTWDTLLNETTDNSGPERTITDNSVGLAGSRFYIVEIE